MIHTCGDLAYCRCGDAELRQAAPDHYTVSPEAARRWLVDVKERIAGLARAASVDRQTPGRWLELLGQYEQARANAWTYAHGDGAQARAERDDMLRRAGLLFAVDAVRFHVRYRRRPTRSVRYAGAEWVEQHVSPALDRMACASDEKALWAMLPGLRQAAAEAMGEPVSAVLDPFAPVAVAR